MQRRAREWSGARSDRDAPPCLSTNLHQPGIESVNNVQKTISLQKKQVTDRLCKLRKKSAIDSNIETTPRSTYWRESEFTPKGTQDPHRVALFGLRGHFEHLEGTTPKVALPVDCWDFFEDHTNRGRVVWHSAALPGL